MLGVNTSDIPNRSLFRQPEVCEIAQVQPYVLRSWESEFPDLGVSKTAGGARVYRRADLERVLRLKHLLFVEGLTLAGARKRLLEEQPPVETEAPALDELLGSDARERILQVKQGLREIAAMLAKRPADGNGGAAHRVERKAARAAGKNAGVGRNFSSAGSAGSTGSARSAGSARAVRSPARSAAKPARAGAKPLFDLAEKSSRAKKAGKRKK